MSIAGDIGHKIVNGDPVNHCDYEFMVSLLDSGDSWRGCGAALIADDKVLTAAHCVDDGNASNLKVLIGSNSMADYNSCSNREIINVVNVDIHPNYVGYDYDIAMLTLETKSRLKPAKYDCNINYEDGQAVKVSGFGTTSSGGPISSQLLEA